MIYLGFLLHTYQPPNQFPHVLDHIVNECYRPLFSFIHSHPQALFTVNMNWALLERLLEGGYTDVISLVKHSLEEGKIEMTGTAAYHAILPLIPEEERERQIELNRERTAEIFGNSYKPAGFFPPEMAYGPEIIEVVKKEGYQWLITDDVPYTCLHGETPCKEVVHVNGMGVLLRSNMWSNKISMEKDSLGRKHRGSDVAAWIEEGMTKWFEGEDGYLILAMDGETFGHHHKGYLEEFLVEFVEHVASRWSTMRLAHLTDIYRRFPGIQKEVPPGSWSTSPQDFWDGNFFPLWKNKNNQAHYLMWQLTSLALEGVERLRDKMDKSLNSCTFWWAATKPEETSPITIMGIDMIMDVIRLADPYIYEKALKIREQLEAALSRKKPEKVS